MSYESFRCVHYSSLEDEFVSRGRREVSSFCARPDVRLQVTDITFWTVQGLSLAGCSRRNSRSILSQRLIQEFSSYVVAVHRSRGRHCLFAYRFVFERSGSEVSEVGV
jgi:hypothetical protein